MDKVYQVFVSSTYSDLKDERRRVSEFLAKDGFIPAGMELFPAADQQQLEFIKRVIDRCDYYVVIVGGRYGSLADDHISFTEKEYDYALERRIPVLAFLHGDPDTIEVGKTDKEATKALKLQAFRDRLSRGRMVDYWSDTYELCAKVVIAVGQASMLFPGVGWVRGNEAIDPKVLQEIERLRIENDELRVQLRDLQDTEITFPPNLARPDSTFEFTVDTITFDLASPYDRKELSRQTGRAIAGMGDVFVRIFESLLAEPNEYTLRGAIGRAVAELGGATFQKELDYSVSVSDVTKLRFHLEALGLIRTGVRKAQYTSSIVWEITDKGRQYVTHALAIRADR